jgi:hypothetical protein
MKWSKAEPDHEGTRDCHRSAKASRAFDERAKTKGDQQYLQSTIWSDSRNRLFHDFELAGLHRDVVEVNRGENNPRDLQHAEGNAVGKAECSQ